MRKTLTGILLLLSLATKAQPYTTKTDVRNDINLRVLTNGSRSITAAQLNRILNGVIDFIPTNTDSLNEGSVNLFYTLSRANAKLNVSDTNEMLNNYRTALNNSLHASGNETKSGILTLTSNPVFTPITKGSILFAGTGGQINQNNTKLFWDSASNQLEVTGYTAVKTGSDGMRWGYDATLHYLSVFPLNLTGGPTGFWNPNNTTAANQSRTNIKSWFSMAYGFYMGTFQDRTKNVMFDASRSKPTVSTYDLGDVVLNAGNTQYFDSKPEVVLWKKIATTGTTAFQWAEVSGDAEYQMQTTNATATNIGIADLTGPGTTKYKMSILAVNSSTGETWSEERIYLFGTSAGNTYPLIFKDLYTPHTFSEATMSGCVVNYYFSGGPPLNQINFYVTGLAATTINWKVQVKRILM